MEQTPGPTMIDLLPLARDAATTPDRRDLLMAVMADDDRLLRRVMEDNIQHEVLLADDFFVPFIGICAAQGSRAFWRTLGDWGYGFQSPLNHSDDRGRGAQMDVGGWAARILDPERLAWLMETGLLEAFKPSTYGLRHSPAELGMLGDDDLFEFWKGQWQQHVRGQLTELTAQQLQNRSPRFPMVLDTLVGMEHVARRGGEYPEAWPAPDTVRRRIGQLLDVFLDLHYGHGDAQAQWKAFIARPARGGARADVFVALCQHASGKARSPFKGLMLDRFLGDKSIDLLMVRGLLESGAPLQSRSKQGLGGQLLAIVARGQDDYANAAWQAWVERARHDTPWMLDLLPGYLQKPGVDYSGRIEQDKAAAERLVEALALSAQAGPAPSDRPRPRL